MSNNPTVSIIVPCYNQAQYLDEALQSVLDQTYTDWECIIVNDGSPDNTAEVAKKWIEKDDRFIYFYKKNGGLSSARNLGLDNCRGNYIQFLDCDDYITENKFSRSICEFNLIENQTKDVVISNFEMFTDNYQRTSKPFCVLTIELLNFDSVLYKWDDTFSIPIHCGLFKSSLFNNFRFPENLRAKEDWVMWIHIFKNKAKAIFINLPLALYRLHPNSMMHTKDMQCDIFNAHKEIESIVTDKEYLELSRTLLLRYYNLYKQNKQKFKALKNSDTFRVALFLKKTIKKLGLLNFAKFFFNYFSKQA